MVLEALPPFLEFRFRRFRVSEVASRILVRGVEAAELAALTAFPKSCLQTAFLSPFLPIYLRGPHCGFGRFTSLWKAKFSLLQELRLSMRESSAGGFKLLAFGESALGTAAASRFGLGPRKVLPRKFLRSAWLLKIFASSKNRGPRLNGRGRGARLERPCLSSGRINSAITQGPARRANRGPHQNFLARRERPKRLGGARCC